MLTKMTCALRAGCRSDNAIARSTPRPTTKALRLPSTFPQPVAEEKAEALRLPSTFPQPVAEEKAAEGKAMEANDTFKIKDDDQDNKQQQSAKNEQMKTETSKEEGQQSAEKMVASAPPSSRYLPSFRHAR